MASKEIEQALEQLKVDLVKSKKPLAIILAGHNGSGKTTLWNKLLVTSFQVPLVNADRMMLSILPELAESQKLPSWASNLRDTDESWMRIAQDGVKAFVANAMARKVPFAQETVFSHWKKIPGGGYESKIDLITGLQKEGYFVLLIFVGLSSAMLSAARVASRKADGGHAVAMNTILERFPRTQKAIAAAVSVADYAILFDNSRNLEQASIARIQTGAAKVFDIRDQGKPVPVEIGAWLEIVSPQPVFGTMPEQEKRLLERRKTVAVPATGERRKIRVEIRKERK